MNPEPNQQLPEPLLYCPPTEPWLDIIHEDRDMIVLNKPSGLLSVPGRTPELADSLLTRVLERCPTAQTVHRLDLGTSGVLVVATRRKAEVALRTQFQDRRSRKVYLAMVWGAMSQETGSVDLPLICDWPNRPRQKVCFATGKAALTEYEVLQRRNGITLIRLYPHTGRSHQLRVHMASLGHPILGDNLYGHQDAVAASSRLLLHALQLGIFHPYTDIWQNYFAPCPFAPQVAAVPLQHSSG